MHAGEHTNDARLRDELRDQASALGFGAFGVAAAEPLDGERARLESWLAAGRHGTMSYMERAVDVRLDPSALLEGARSVICVAHVYATEQADEDPSPFVARYARGRDYHRVLRGKLRRLVETIHSARPEARSRICVDTAPLLEKAWAERAGIGWRGKHTNLVSRSLGSWTVLGEILTTVALEPDRPHLDHCGSCTRCLDACPTNAFPEPYMMDARRCISYLTIEHRGPFDDEEASAIGGRLFGCDDCLQVCPWNRFHTPTEEPDFSPRDATIGAEAAEWLTMPDEEMDERLRGSAMRRARFDGLRRNAGAVVRNRTRSSG